MSRRRQRKIHDPRVNTHHVLFYRRLWDKGYKHFLRREFVYEIPVDIHDDLHATVGPVPPLDEAEAKWLWEQYKATGRNMGLFEALAWLQMHSPNSEFAMAIMAQYGFLSNHLGRS